MLRDCDFRPVFHRSFNHEPFRHISQSCPRMPANGLLYARRSGQGDLEPDGEAVAGVRRILRGPPISVRHAGRDPPPKDAFTFGLRSPLATDNNKAVAGAWRCCGDVPGLVINPSVHLLIPVPISPREMDQLNNSSAGERRGSGGLVMHGVMRALIARWLALIAMLGLLALVIATSRIPCVPYGLWPTLQMHCR